MVIDKPERTVSCPYCGDVTEQPEPMLREYTCGKCDEPFTIQTTKFKWAMVNGDPVPDNPVWRRFGRNHEKPCRNPDVLTCALPRCQYAGECQDD